MQVNGINLNYQNSPSFKSAYVTTSTKNHGDYVEKEVITPFQDTAIEISNEYGHEFEDIIENTNVFVLGAGAGSRFKPLAMEQGKIVNKISFRIPTVDKSGKPNGKAFHMLDLPMALAAPLIDDNGLQRLNAEVARGSFAEVITIAKELRVNGEPQKNVIVMCGDNFFDSPKSNPFELLHFAKSIINNPNKQLGLVGVEREPEEVVNTFGMLKVIPTGKDDIMKLDGFKEKPSTLEEARKFETPSGKCIANTGMFVIKAEAMEWLLDEIEQDPTFLAKLNKDGTKDEKEIYDFAKACEKVQEKYGTNKSDVKIINTWEDAGEPDALYRTISEIQKGHFLACLPKDLQEEIRHSASVVYDGTSLLASPESIERFGNAKNLTNKIKQITGDDTKLSKIDSAFISTSTLDISV